MQDKMSNICKHSKWSKIISVLNNIWKEIDVGTMDALICQQTPIICTQLDLGQKGYWWSVEHFELNMQGKSKGWKFQYHFQPGRKVWEGQEVLQECK